MQFIALIFVGEYSRRDAIAATIAKCIRALRGARYGTMNIQLPLPALMPIYTAQIEWNRGEQSFIDNRYSRRHVMRFDGGAEIPGSSSPHVVRVPLSDPTAVDPEEAFVASLSSCHMLWFLSIAARQKFTVDSYTDNAEGTMGQNARGKSFISVVTLRPSTIFSGEKIPSKEELLAMHEEAHEECFIANSVLATVRCEPVWVAGIAS